MSTYWLTPPPFADNVSFSDRHSAWNVPPKRSRKSGLGCLFCPFDPFDNPRGGHTSVSVCPCSQGYRPGRVVLVGTLWHLTIVAIVCHRCVPCSCPNSPLLTLPRFLPHPQIPRPCSVLPIDLDATARQPPMALHLAQCCRRLSPPLPPL